MARRRRQSEEEFAQELAAHLAHETDRLVADLLLLWLDPRIRYEAAGE